MRIVCVAFLLAVAALITTSASMLPAEALTTSTTTTTATTSTSSSLRRPPPRDELPQYTFTRFTQDFGKTYRTEEERAYRQSVFHHNVNKIMTHNADIRHSYKMNVNHMADLTTEEFASRNRARRSSSSHRDTQVASFAQQQQVPSSSSSSLKVAPNTNTNTKAADYYKLVDAPPAPFTGAGGPFLPKSVDYRVHSFPVLTAIKDQGQCGSCWAFASTEAMESMWALATGQLSVLSTQQITACSSNPHHCGGTGGCDGSIGELAYEYATTQGGVVEEWQYPYSAYQGETGQCVQQQGSGALPSARFKGYVHLPANDQTALMAAVATVGPVAVTVAAGGWHLYESGVFDGCDYEEPIITDHLVHLVGYGTDEYLGKDYWLVRNSWGASYGEGGYIRLLREATPRCGWDTDPKAGAGCDDAPAKEYICGQCGILSDSAYPLPDV